MHILANVIMEKLGVKTTNLMNLIKIYLKTLTMRSLAHIDRSLPFETLRYKAKKKNLLKSLEKKINI